MSNGSANAKSNHWQPFIYMGESPHPDGEGRHGDNFPEQGNGSAAHMTSLAMAQVGDRVRILSLNCGEANNRLMGMGLLPGAVLEVISRVSPGSVIVSLQDQRLGLGAEMARRIQVIDADQCEADQYADQSSKHPQPSPTRTLETMQTTPDTSPVKLRDAAIGSVFTSDWL
jgi:ferrous iron transport protein A